MDNEADTTLRTHPTDTESVHEGNLRNKSRQNSDVSQMEDGTMGKRVASPDSMSTASTKLHRKSSSSLGTAASTLREDSRSPPLADQLSDASASLPATKASSPATSPSARPDLRQAASSPRLRGRSPVPAHVKSNGLRDSPKMEKVKSPAGLGAGSKALKGTIARAMVDTTLAVIPAKAFKTLTKKYPKASGTVVQVVLERFSRVTFMTGTCYSFLKLMHH